MKSLSLATSRRALILFGVLAAVFMAQMIWWIIFQVRTTAQTRDSLTGALADKQTCIITVLNGHYQAMHDAITESLNDGFSVQTIANYAAWPSISGIAEDDHISPQGLSDSLYYVFINEQDSIVVFLNREYPGELLAGKTHLYYIPPPPGELRDITWVTDRQVVIDPEGVSLIEDEQERHRRMLTMEGGFFILLILLGAWLIYDAMKRARRLEQEHILFVRSITHELKIPISAINLFLDTLKRRQFDSSLARELVPKMKQDIARLNDLIDNLLQVRSLWEDTHATRRETISISEELSRFATAINDRVRAAGGTVKYSCEPELFIRADASELARVWDILVDNSLKYAASDHIEIGISLRRVHDRAEIVFIDNGPGVASEDTEKIFEQFYRGGVGKEKSIPGSGLGLYIAREFVRRNGGTITLRNGKHGGCEATMKFRLTK
ncbi:MAG: HAMP domain-containing histidine kinase [candidate division Zixibacteria bacterium]|nr:HAMP domain-containing histidine kinase [candidate division Zixibacteria bacterium]